MAHTVTAPGNARVVASARSVMTFAMVHSPRSGGHNGSTVALRILRRLDCKL